MFLGVEIGGTKLQAALGDGSGSLHGHLRVAARPADGRAGICDQLHELIESLLRQTGVAADQVRGVVGFGGPVDRSRGRVVTSHQVSGWDDFPLVEWFAQWGPRMLLRNDSDMAGLAEAHLGAGRGHDTVVYMNIGSGIGGALIRNDELYYSSATGDGACEIGHLRIRPAESQDPSQPWSTLESLCSGWRLEKAAQAAAEATPHSLLWELAGGDRDAITTPLLSAAVARGDPAAVGVWETAIEYLGVALSNVVTLLGPDCIVVGGGVALVGDLLFEPLRQQVDRQVFAPYRGLCAIVPAALGEEVVLHGALLTARQCFVND